jgi:endonuclease YncB( thermonuclease family)
VAQATGGAEPMAQSDHPTPKAALCGLQHRSSTPSVLRERGTVTKVVDGNTIKVRLRYAHDPVRRVGSYRDAQRHARSHDLGIWRPCS